MKARRLIGGGVLAIALIITSATAAISGNVTDTSQSSQQIVSMENHTQSASATGLVVEKTFTVQTAGSTVTDTTSQTQAVTDKAVSTTQKKATSVWDNRLLSNAKKYAVIYTKTTTKSKYAGKLYRGSYAKVITKTSTWTKIKSGSVTGYVKTKQCIFGEKAKTRAEKIYSYYAKAKISGVKVKQKADSSSKTLVKLKKGASLKVKSTSLQKSGWITVNYKGKKAYVAVSKVSVSLKMKTAISAAAEKKAKARAAAYKKKVKMLAALIKCEAGGESAAGKLAVGAVVINRTQCGRYPGSVSGVIYQKGQFSPVASGIYKKELKRVQSQSCIKAAKAALSGKDNTGGALYFHAGKSSSGKVIGNQTFY